MSDATRQAFHRYLQSRGIPSELFQQEATGNYEFATVEHDWQVWSAAIQAVDAYPALQALTEAVLTRADNDYMDRQIDAAVKVMASRGWLPPVRWPRRDEGSPCPARESTATQARAAASEPLSLSVREVKP